MKKVAVGEQFFCTEKTKHVDISHDLISKFCKHNKGTASFGQYKPKKDNGYSIQKKLTPFFYHTTNCISQNIYPFACFRLNKVYFNLFIVIWIAPFGLLIVGQKPWSFDTDINFCLWDTLHHNMPKFWLQSHTAISSLFSNWHWSFRSHLKGSHIKERTNKCIRRFHTNQIQPALQKGTLTSTCFLSSRPSIKKLEFLDVDASVSMILEVRCSFFWAVAERAWSVFGQQAPFLLELLRNANDRTCAGLS